MGTYKSYLLGFILSILLTLSAYFVVANQLLAGGVTVFTIMALAIIQLFVQLVLFLHIGHEVGPRWKLAALISTIGLILIVVIGSLWIISNLNYHMPSNEQIMDDENIHR
jgi:cytochrome o ubiquinol oxidase subunit IV